MNDVELNRLREAAWRRELTAEESARLAAALAGDPEVAAQCRSEARLGQSLRALPSAPVPSNFTACVMQALEREAQRAPERSFPLWSWKGWRRWAPKMAVAGLVCVVVVLGWRQHQETRRRQLADSLQRFTALAAAPAPGGQVSVEIWQNFDIIRRMSGVGPDEELLTVAKTQ